MLSVLSIGYISIGHLQPGREMHIVIAIFEQIEMDCMAEKKQGDMTLGDFMKFATCSRKGLDDFCIVQAGM